MVRDWRGVAGEWGLSGLWLLAVAMAAVIGGCAASEAEVRATQKSRDLVLAESAADGLESQGNYEAARKQWVEVARLRQGSEVCQAMMRRCYLYGRQGLTDSALRCYQGFVALDHPQVSPEASLRLGEIQWRQGAIEEALTQWRRVMTRWPRSSFAERALHMLRGRHRQRMGAVAEVDFLLGIASELERLGSPRRILAMAQVLAGEIAFGDLNDPLRAASILEKALYTSKGTVLYDDALFWSARALHAVGEHELAAQRFEVLIGTHESSWFMGRYDSQWIDESVIWLGRVRVAQGMPLAAIDIFESLEDLHDESVWLDDAAFEAAKLKKSLGDNDALMSFVKRFPESRFVGQVDEDR